MKKIILIAAFFAGLTAFAQESPWTLRQCIDHALDNNLSVRQGVLSVEEGEIAVHTAESSRPACSAARRRTFPSAAA